MENNGRKENVTIKGISSEIYNKVKQLAKETGKTIGEITNDAYNTILMALDDVSNAGNDVIKMIKNGEIKVIENVDEISLTGEEIRKFNRKIIIKNIQRLELKEIHEEDISKFIVSINNVGLISVPKGFNKLALLEKARFIGKIEEK
jgi:hypothetical protein